MTDTATGHHDHLWRPAVTASLYVGFVLSFMSSPLTARGLGPAGRGDFALFLALVTIGPAVAGLGWNTAARVLAPSVETARLASTTTWLATRLALVTTVPSLGAVSYMALRGHEATPTQLAVAAGVALSPVGVLRTTALSVFIGVGDHRKTTLATLIFPSLAHILIVGLFLGGWLTLTSAIGATIIASALQGGALASLRDAASRTNTSRLSIREILSACRQSSGVQTAEILVQRADIAYLMPLIGRAELGRYAVASGISALSLPIAQGLVASNHRDIADGLITVRHVGVRITVLTAALALAVAISAPVLIPFAFGRTMSDAVLPTQICAVAMIPFGLAYLLAQSLTIRGRGTSAAAILMSGVVVNVALAILLRRHGATGAAIATLLANTSVLCIYLLLGRRRRLRDAQDEQVVPPIEIDLELD